MLFIYQNTIKILPVLRLELFNKENNFLVSTALLKKILVILKNHFKFQYKMLTCISGVDYPENFFRFHIVYELLSLKFNSRLRLKICVNELIPVNSIKNIFSSSS